MFSAYHHCFIYYRNRSVDCITLFFRKRAVSQRSPLILHLSSWAVLISSSRGCLGNGETPAGERGRRDPTESASERGGSKKKEEVRLKPSRPVTTSNDPTSCGAARGKRVVPQTPQPLNKRNGPIYIKMSQPLVFHISNPKLSE